MGLTLSRQLLTTSATSQWRQCSFTLSFVIAGTRGGTETKTYTDAESFRDAFQGFRFMNPQTADLPKYHMDSSVVYIAKHPLLTAHFDKWSPNEVTDKVFMNKACAALEHHHQPRSVWCRVPNDRDIKDGWWILTRKDVVEWEGIWESSNSHVYFLEVKQSLMNLDKLAGIREKLERSRCFLSLEESKVTVYLAGNHWNPLVIKVAQSSMFGFGVLTSNGQDLTVLDPSPA